jgi:hypothetical protein
VVRHHLVQRIVRAYDEHRGQQQMLLLGDSRESRPVSEKPTPSASDDKPASAIKQ